MDGSAWELGYGAMGDTYRAIDKALDRPVALKIINTYTWSHSAEARERFMREARAAAACDIRTSRPCINWGFPRKRANSFMLIELVQAKRSEERVRRSGPLDILTTIEIALQVIAALEAAEERGLVHRDQSRQPDVGRGAQWRISGLCQARTPKRRAETDGMRRAVVFPTRKESSISASPKR